MLSSESIRRGLEMGDRYEDVRQSGSRTRGRIATVLADARASLSEPSRPFTPASLDARTWIDLKSLDKYGRIAMSKNSSFGRLPGDYEGHLSVQSQSRTRYFEDPGVNQLRKSSSSDRDKRALSATKSSSSNLSGSRSVTASGEADDILMAVYRIKVAISSDDVAEEGGQDETVITSADGGLNLINVVSLREICVNAYEAVDKLSKYLKSTEARTNANAKGKRKLRAR